MRNFLKQALYTYKGLFMWLNLPGYISSIILYPIANVLMYSLIGRFGGGSASAAFAIGVVMLSMSFSAVNGLAQSYSYELSFGTLAFFYASKANRLKSFLARGVMHFPNTIIAFVLGLATSCVVANLSLADVNWASLILSVFAVAFSLIGFGQILGIISIITRNWITAQAMALGVLTILCGAIIPINVFPGIFQGIAHALPITNGLIAAREAFIGASISQTSTSIIFELVVGACYMIIAYVGFRVFEMRAKQTGQLERDAR